MSLIRVAAPAVFLLMVLPTDLGALAPAPAGPRPALVSGADSMPGDTKDERMAWWREARFGLFIHWGLYAIPAGEWNGNTGHAEWIRTTAQIPIDRYDQFVNQFNPTRFDAGAWVRLAKEAGMRYIVITSKHHDGFCLFDSKYTDYDVMSTPFKRDIMKELAEACRREGLRMCWYHSIMDWHHPDYLPRRGWEKRSAEGADLDRYVEHLRHQVTELLTKYGPIGVMWFDGEWESTWNHEYGQALYDLCRTLQPDVIVNNRVDVGRAGMEGMTQGGERAGDYGTPEQRIPETGLPGADWETCMTMNDHWGYNKHDDHWKSTEQIIHMLVDIASKGGNYLLNVGPKADGTFPQPAIDRLKEVGKWMAVHGEAIYGTQASPFKGLAWGRCTSKRTAAGTRLYLHVFDWPADGRLVLGGLGNPVVGATLLEGSRASLDVESQPGELVIHVPSQAPDPICPVVRLEITGVPVVYEAPQIECDSDWLVRPVRVRMTITSPKLAIHYTTDGSDPDGDSPRYAEPILVTGTTLLKARTFHEGRPVSGIVQQRLERVTPAPGQSVVGLAQGLRCQVYQGRWDSLPDFSSLEPQRTEVRSDIALGGDRGEYLGRRFSGYLWVPDDDVYRLALASDDGSRLLVDGRIVVDNDGLHGMTGLTKSVALGRGFHPIEVLWFNKTGGADLALEMAGTGAGLRPVPADQLFHLPAN